MQVGRQPRDGLLLIHDHVSRLLGLPLQPRHLGDEDGGLGLCDLAGPTLLREQAVRLLTPPAQDRDLAPLGIERPAQVTRALLAVAGDFLRGVQVLSADERQLERHWGLR